MITMKKLEEQIERVNLKLKDICESNISIEFYRPDYFPGIIILKDGVRLGERYDGIHYGSVQFGSSKRDVHTALGRALKFLWARDQSERIKQGKRQQRFISDCEVCGIFEASFWK